MSDTDGAGAWKNILEARDLRRRYGEGEAAVDALAGVTVDFPKGRYAAIMGPSGSGKSTLLHTLAGLDRPTSGTVRIAGVELTALDDRRLTQLRRDRIGFIFQTFNLLPVLNAEENILLPLSIAGHKVDREWFDRLVDTVGIRDRLSHRPAELSGGQQQQRVAVARALISRPAVVFADEPSGNLDSKASNDVLELLHVRPHGHHQPVLRRDLPDSQSRQRRGGHADPVARQPDARAGLADHRADARAGALDAGRGPSGGRDLHAGHLPGRASQTPYGRRRAGLRGLGAAQALRVLLPGARDFPDECRRGGCRPGERRTLAPEDRRTDDRGGLRARAHLRDRRHHEVRGRSVLWRRRRGDRHTRRGAAGDRPAGALRPIDVAAAAGVTPGELRARIRAVLPRTVAVRTGSQQAAKDSSDLEENLSFLRTFLLVFAYVALVVGAFIIFNTFSITVAQRTREFGLLRTLAASRRQVMQSVVFEGLLLGIGGAVVGLLGGIALAPALDQLFKSFGADLPDNGTVLQTRTIVVSLLVGVSVTVLAGLAPAVRATRVPPLAAMREGVEISARRRLFRRRYLIIRPLARAIGLLVSWRGITGRLARENSVRQPGRTIITAAALTVGLALVTFVAVLADGTKATIDQAVSRSFAGDLIVENSQAGAEQGIPALVAPAVRRVPGVASVTPVAFTVGRLHGSSDNSTITAIDPSTFGRAYRVAWKQGSNATLLNLGSAGTVLTKGYAEAHHLTVGQSVSLLTPTNRHVTLTVRGIAEDNARLLGNLTISLRLARASFGQRDDALDFVSYASGASNAQVQPAVNRLLASSFPQARSRTAAQFKQDQANQINTLLALIYVLLALSVIVSLFGIVNTLILSIYERTRELGMMRAIGTSRRQVRQMIRYESVITALIGGVFGLLIGVVGAILVTNLALSGSGYVQSFPVGTLIVLLLVAALAGLVAAQLPGRRAARLDLLRSLAAD